MKHFTPVLTLVAMLLTAASFLYAASPGSPQPADEKSSHNALSLLELKQLADSTYFRSDRRDAAEPLYLELMRRGRDLSSPDDEKIMAAAYSNYATFLIFERNNPTLAYPLLKQSLALLEKYRDDGLCIISTYTNLSHIYANFNDTAKALDYLVQGFNNTLRTRSPERAGYIYAQLLYMAWDFGSPAGIRDVTDRFKSDSRLRDGRLYDYNIALTGALEEYGREHYSEAAEILKAATPLIDAEYDRNIYRAMTMLMAADSYIRADMLQQARECIDAAIADMNGYNEMNGREFLNKVSARYYRAIGHPEIAREFQVRTLMLRDSLYSARNLTTISDLEQELLSTQFTTQLHESRLEQELLRLRSTRLQWVLAVIISAAAIIIILLIFLGNRRRKLTEARYALLIERLTSQNQPVASSPAAESAEMNGSQQEHKTTQTDTDQPSPEVFDRINQFLEQSEMAYEPGFSIDTLAAQLDLTVKQVSRAINCFAGKNFNLHLADFRIRKACNILLDNSISPRPTIEYVAEKVGYKSRSYFSRTFKTVTGLTTTEFIKQSDKHLHTNTLH